MDTLELRTLQNEKSILICPKCPIWMASTVHTCIIYIHNVYIFPMYMCVGRSTGITLWFQQFYAMFLKRFYNSLRFYTAVIIQLIIPLLFIILALLIVKLPDNSPRDDPRRLLTLSRSSMSDDAEVFWAHFVDVPSEFSFEVGNIISVKVEPTSVVIKGHFLQADHL